MTMLALQIWSFAFIRFCFRGWTSKINMNIRGARTNIMSHNVLVDFFTLNSCTNTLQGWQL